jgi:small GTP-binding protein
MDYDYNFKIVVIGDYETGKTSLIKRITDDIFISKQKSFLLNNSENQKYIKKNNKNIKLNFFDVDGKDKIQTIKKTIYNNCNAIIVTLDLTSLESFRSIPYWIEKIKNNTNLDFFILVGTKADQTNIRCISEQKIQNLCKNYENNNIIYIETSSKTGKNIVDLCDVIIESIFSHNTDKISQISDEDNNNKKKTYNTFDNYNMSETIQLVKKNNDSKLKRIINKYFFCFKFQLNFMK